MKIVSYISSIKAGKRYNAANPITAALDSIVSAANNSGGEFVAYKHEGTHTVSADLGFCFGSYTQRKLEVERAVLIRNIEAAKQPVFFLDSSAFSTHIRNALNSSETFMFRVGLNSCTGEGTFWNQPLPAERYNAMKKQFKIFNQLGKIFNMSKDISKSYYVWLTNFINYQISCALVKKFI